MACSSLSKYGFSSLNFAGLLPVVSCVLVDKPLIINTIPIYRCVVFPAFRFEY